MDMKISYSEIGSTTQPAIFGPAMWFTFHNGAVLYPKHPHPCTKYGMKQLLINMPLMIPCLNCKEHFYNFIRNADLDKAVSSRDELFKFWVDVHNYVNGRYGKPIVSLEEAKQLYGFYKPEVGSRIRITYTSA
ncbi:MAG: FAD-linked sulfhydryl oxidase [Aeromonas popoffii]|uniref:FAD-linked sulfhydryl oxidase n=1 Tax=Aeromonas popoffii TaxID=70856 RepID=UPI003F2BCE36